MSSQQCAPPCRCKFVQKWVEEHAKYFTNSVSKPELPPLVARIVKRSFPSKAYNSYQSNDAMEIRSNLVNSMYIQPPYKISPMKPPHLVPKQFN